MKRNFERTESLFDGFTAATVQTTEAKIASGLR